MIPRDYLLGHIPKNSVGVEIGVHKGDYSNKILQHANPKMLNLVDPWKKFTDETYKKSWYGAQVSQTQMDVRYQNVLDKFSKNDNVRVIRDYSYNAVNEFSDDSLDWIYVDGDHTFEGVFKDFSLYYDKIKIGGYIYGDDYMTGWWGTGVIDALHKILHEKNLKIVFVFGSQFCCVKL